MKSPFASSDTQADGSSTRRTGALTSLLGGGRTYFILAIVAALVATFASLAILGRSADRSTYYVLNQDVPARTVITSDMLAEVETAAGTEPPNALTPSSVVSEAIFTRVPLQTGDVVTPAVAGPLERIDTDLPDGYVVASFAVQPQDAVAGKIRRGDVIDVIAVQQDALAMDDIASVATTPGMEDTRAKVVLHRVLVLDVTTDPNTIAQGANDNTVAEGVVEPGPESAAIRGGIPQLYVVAVSPEDAATLALVRDKNLMVVLSANDTLGEISVEVTESQVFDSLPVPDSSAGVSLDANDTVVEDSGAVDPDSDESLSDDGAGIMDQDTQASEATTDDAPVQ